VELSRYTPAKLTVPEHVNEIDDSVPIRFGTLDWSGNAIGMVEPLAIFSYHDTTPSLNH
jgi:hypothetical protein